MLGQHTKRWVTRDWAEWDLEHPYIPKGQEEMSSKLGGVQWSIEGVSSQITAAAAAQMKDPGIFGTDDSNKYQETARGMMEEIAKSPPAGQTLYSGHSMSTEFSDQVNVVGAKFPIPMMAASPNQDLANAYASTGSKDPFGGKLDDVKSMSSENLKSLLSASPRTFGEPSNTPVIYKFDPSTPAAFYRENEHLTSGDFHITAVDKVPDPSGNHYITKGGTLAPVTQTMVSLKYDGPSAMNDLDTHEKSEDEDVNDFNEAHRSIGFRLMQGMLIINWRDWALWDEEHEGERNAADAAWHAPVTEDQGAAIKEYTGFGYGMINNTLRQPDVNDLYSPDKLAEAKQNGDLIHDAMRPLPDDATLYRGIDPVLFPSFAQWQSSKYDGTATSDRPEKFDFQSLVGTTVKDNGFASTSHSQSVGESWDFHGAVAEIHAPAGTPAIDLSSISSGGGLNEHEILLDRGTSFRVTSVDTSGDHPHFQMEVVK